MKTILIAKTKLYRVYKLERELSDPREIKSGVRLTVAEGTSMALKSNQVYNLIDALDRANES